MKRITGLIILVLTVCLPAHSQYQSQGSLDSLKREIINLRLDVQDVKLTLSETKRSLRKGIFVATLGYTVTIIGGQLLGTRPQLGEALLYTGGAIGVTGTVIMVKGFNKLDSFNKNTLPPPDYE